VAAAAGAVAAAAGAVAAAVGAVAAAVGAVAAAGMRGSRCGRRCGRGKTPGVARTADAEERALVVRPMAVVVQEAGKCAAAGVVSPA
jgi:hypothetical protein